LRDDWLSLAWKVLVARGVVIVRSQQRNLDRADPLVAEA
jgi:hypothetical protein